MEAWFAADVDTISLKSWDQIAKEHGGIMRFIQVSCLGASPSSPSRMLRAKAAAEEAVLREFPEATIMKPGTLIGTEDRILNRWAQFAKKWSFLPLIGDGSTKIQPIYVVDAAAGIIASLKDDGSSMGKVYELGGPDVFTVHQLILFSSRWLTVDVDKPEGVSVSFRLCMSKMLILLKDQHEMVIRGLKNNGLLRLLATSDSLYLIDWEMGYPNRTTRCK